MTAAVNHCRTPVVGAAPSSECSSFASTREGSKRGETATQPPVATIAQTRKCGQGATSRRAARAPPPAPRMPPRLCVACSPESTGRPISRWTVTPWAFIATSATLLRTANENKLPASTRRLGRRLDPTTRRRTRAASRSRLGDSQGEAPRNRRAGDRVRPRLPSRGGRQRTARHSAPSRP